jgi:hypothetical protein
MKGIMIFVVLFSLCFLSLMFIGPAPEFGEGGQPGAAIVVPEREPGITEPGHPIFEGVTAMIALVGGGWFIWRNILGGTTTPVADAVRRHG